jgi:multiple sugar transport system substrate-binding protein
LAGVAISLLTGCSSSGGSSGPVKLTVWDWTPGMNRCVADFNKANPNIHATLSDVGAGSPEYTKLENAVQAGNGAPDVALLEYDELPSFEALNSVVDQSKYGSSKYKKDFVPWVWDQVSKGSSVYAMPNDSGPMGLLYNATQLTKAGITPPTTWAQFATDANKLHKANPSTYLTNFSPTDLQWMAGLMAQDGAFPFKYSGGKKVTIDFTGQAQTAFANYWDGLISSGAVNSTSDVSSTSFRDMDNGTDASWLSPGWGPAYMSPDMTKTTGQWRSTTLPQWSAGATASSNFGGSSYAVMKQSSHPAQAAKLAQYLGGTKDCWNIQIGKPALAFPSYLPILNTTSFANQTIPLTGSSPVHQAFIKSAQSVKGVEWPPFMTKAGTEATTAFAGVGQGKQSLKSAFAAFQKTLVSYAKAQGYTVSTS